MDPPVRARDGLSRFVEAQKADYGRALAELQAGRKLTHWMWYIFPQLAGLGSSAMSLRYGIRHLAEARAFVAHPVLGPRLFECFEAVETLTGLSAHEIFGSPDDLKLRSCATLFAAVARDGSVFQRVLEKYFEGEPDRKTLGLLAAGR
jgi:uncharacterized protein (DUF1810 family)